MPVLTPTERRGGAARLLLAVIYALLTAGALSMVLPFLFMVSGAFKTSVDSHDLDIVPAWFHDDTLLYRKHLECKYNNSPAKYALSTGMPAAPWRAIEPPPLPPTALIADWRDCEARLTNTAWYELGYTAHAGDRLELWQQREFRRHLMRGADGDVRVFNRRFGVELPAWSALGSIQERWIERRFQPGGEPVFEAYQAFKRTAPAWLRVYVSVDNHFIRHYLQPLYGADIAAYNAAHATRWTNWSQVGLDERAPAAPAARQDWERYVRRELGLGFIRVDDSARPAFAAFLRTRAPDGAPDGTPGEPAAIFAPDDLTRPGARLNAWSEFIQTAAPLEALRVETSETVWRRWLGARYDGDRAALNRAHGADYAALERVPLPARARDRADIAEHHAELRREFRSATFRQVVDYLAGHGRSLWNTALYCALNVLVALTINPLAAYALSRFRPRATYRILLFGMATMAFPAAITMIPGFLLLKGLGWLNTFAALVLPGAANGFSIFLLKGFFDALPRELYEAAQLDGAGEWVLFRHVTMALSRPILAVMALGAFTAAYGNFMFALILCPDDRMWTLMVFLYQLQVNGHPALTQMAMLIAAIPTLSAFLLCQRVILRGIVVPVAK